MLLLVAAAVCVAVIVVVRRRKAAAASGSATTLVKAGEKSPELEWDHEAFGQETLTKENPMYRDSESTSDPTYARISDVVPAATPTPTPAPCPVYDFARGSQSEVGSHAPPRPLRVQNEEPQYYAAGARSVIVTRE